MLQYIIVVFMATVKHDIIASNNVLCEHMCHEC